MLSGSLREIVLIPRPLSEPVNAQVFYPTVHLHCCDILNAMSKQTNKVIAPLSSLLASSYTLYLKTHNYHWNVTGPMFTTLHTLCIRTLGAHAPGSYTAFSKLSKVKEETGHPDAKTIIEQLVADQAAIVEVARTVFKAAEKAGDQVTTDLATRRMEVHAKNAWMLRSHLE